MKFKTAAVLAMTLGFASMAGASQAGVYQDDFVRCLVAKTTQSDRQAFVRWIFTSMSANAEIKDLSTVTEAQRTAATEVTSHLIQRLIFTDCRTQAVAAVRYEGQTAFVAGFEMVGKVAMGDLMADPAVAVSLSGLDTYFDKSAMEVFVQDVQAPTSASAPAPAH
jgi:hypothetical protein